MNAEDSALLDRFAGINIWRRGDERAPHKPLLLLYALARLQRGEPRFVSFEELDEHVRHLLMEFGPPRKSFHPEYPFWHLQADGLWEIPQLDELNADLERRSRTNNPPKSVLKKVNAEGGLPAGRSAVLSPAARVPQLTTSTGTARRSSGSPRDSGDTAR